MIQNRSNLGTTERYLEEAGRPRDDQVVAAQLRRIGQRHHHRRPVAVAEALVVVAAGTWVEKNP